MRDLTSYRTRLFLLIWSISFVCNNAQIINGAAFTNVLQSIANNALGVAKVQEQYDKVIYRNTLLDGVGLVTEISSSLSRKFDGPIQALKKIKDAVEQDVRDNAYTTRRVLPECCHATGVTYSSKFRSKINTNEACMTISSDSPPGSTFPTSRIQEIMKENYRLNPNLKWQYFGKEDGVYVNYPSVKLSDCSNYDPRYRPFYVTTATPVEKDVVVVIDRSGSMSDYHDSRTLLQIAKEAAISVLDTLNPNDRFGVVAFDSLAVIPGANINQRSCHETKLAQATPLNIKYMKNQIRGLYLGGSTNYESAINYAFRFFINTPDNSLLKRGNSSVFFILFFYFCLSWITDHITFHCQGSDPTTEDPSVRKFASFLYEGWWFSDGTLVGSIILKNDPVDKLCCHTLLLNSSPPLSFSGTIPRQSLVDMRCQGQKIST